MSHMVNVMSSFERYNLPKKIEEAQLSHTDFIYIRSILEIHLSILKPFYVEAGEPNESWDGKKILIAAHTIRLQQFFKILTYLSIVLFGSTHCVSYPNVDYVEKLSGQNPYRKELLMNFIFKSVELIHLMPKTHPDYNFCNDLIQTFSFTQDNFKNILISYFFKTNHPQDVRFLAYYGEFTFYTSFYGVHFLEMDGFNKRTVCRNLELVGTTDLKIHPYPRYWDKDVPEYNPNHFFASLKQ
jgi:hypothetical protein